MHIRMAALAGLVVALAACQPSGPTPPPANAPPATSISAPQHSAEVRRLLAAARDNGETHLDLNWNESSLGGYDGARAYEALFNRLYGTDIRVTFTPGPSMTDMSARITQELAAGRKASSDVHVGSDRHFVTLLKAEVLEPFDYTQLSPRIGRELIAPNGIGVAIYSTVPGIVYNSELIPPGEVPRRLEDVLAPSRKGTIASQPNAAYFDVVATRPEWGPERMKGFVTRLSDHIGGLIRVGEESRLVSGEFTMMVLGNASNVTRARAQGAPLEFAVPPDSAVVRFIYLGVPRNAAHPNLAKLFINLVLSEEGQRANYAIGFQDHHALPGSQFGGDLRARGVSLDNLFKIDVHFALEHPENSQLSEELTAILRERPGRGGLQGSR
jgi:ABC-type Fe3+ transport system substrate-binding protein